MFKLDNCEGNGELQCRKQQPGTGGTKKMFKIMTILKLRGETHREIKTSLISGLRGTAQQMVASLNQGSRAQA